MGVKYEEGSGYLCTHTKSCALQINSISTVAEFLQGLYSSEEYNSDIIIPSTRISEQHRKL